MVDDDDYPFFYEKIFNKVTDYLLLPNKFLESRIDIESEKLGNQIGSAEALLTFIGILIGVVGFVYESVFKVTEVVERICIGAFCNDGWYSESVGRGTCSWHSGIHHYVYKDIVTHYNETYEMVYVFFLVLIILFAGYRCFYNDSVRKSLVSTFRLSIFFVSKYIWLAIYLLLVFVILVPQFLLSIPKFVYFMLRIGYFLVDLGLYFFKKGWWKYRYRKLLKKKSNFTRTEILKLITVATYVPLNFEGVDFEKSDLSNLDLLEVNLTGANLKGANLTGANLKGAKLTWSDLTGADLTGADLTGVTGYNP